MSIMRNSALAFAPKALAIMTGIVTSVITARYLGPSGRGVLSLVLLAAAVLSLIGDLGLGASITYFVSKGRLRASEALAFSVYASFAAGIVVAWGALALWPVASNGFMNGVPTQTFTIALTAVPAMLFVNLWVRLEMASGRFEATMLYQSLQALGLLTVNVGVLLVARLDVQSLVAGIAGVWLLIATAMFASSMRAHGFTRRVPIGLIREILNYGLRSYAGGLVYYSTLRFDTFVLNAYAGNSAVGQYSMAVTLTEKLWLVDSAVGQATMPEVVSREKRSAAELVAATSRTVMLVGLLLGGVLFILAPQVVGILYGEAFLPAVVPLRLLIPGVILYSSSRILTQFYVGQLGRPGVASIISATTATISLALYFALVPRFGFNGAAIASSIAYTTNFIISSTLFWHATGMGFTNVLIPTTAEVRRVRNTLGAVGRRIRPHSS